jgi:hypothetical protein
MTTPVRVDVRGQNGAPVVAPVSGPPVVVRPGGGTALVVTPIQVGEQGIPGPPGHINVVSLTQGEFDAMPTKDPSTIYIITE